MDYGLRFHLNIKFLSYPVTTGEENLHFIRKTKKLRDYLTYSYGQSWAGSNSLGPGLGKWCQGLACVVCNWQAGCNPSNHGPRTTAG